MKPFARLRLLLALLLFGEGQPYSQRDQDAARETLERSGVLRAVC
jgi:hypothetical protein